MLGGYTGRSLKIDLGKKKAEEIVFSDEVLKKYIGGRGLIDYYMYNQKPGIEAFSEENPIIIATGPVTGTLAPTSGRFAVGSISPLTDILSVGYCGGHWAPELKYAGFDVLIITGCSKEPMYILIEDQQVSFLDAEHIWGQNTRMTEKLIREENNCEELRILSIGPAGENRVNFASIMVDCHHTVGRGGTGAVMGWKNLKAVAVRGTGGVRPGVSVEKMRDEMMGIFKIIRENRTYPGWRQLGTVEILPIINEFGILPTRNFSTGYFDDIDKISGNRVAELIAGTNSCFNCNIGCTGTIRKTVAGGKELVTERPEYETFWSFGPLIDNNDLDGLLQFAHFCDLMGFDTMEAGHVLAFTADLYSRNLISKKELGGLEPVWGDVESYWKLLQGIVHREGFGDILANGIKKAAGILGEEAQQLARHVKGFIVSGYDPRGSMGMALNYATAARGADHNRGYSIAAELLGTLGHKDRLDQEKTPALISTLHQVVALVDSSVMCTFTRDLGLFNKYPEILRLVTGLKSSDEEFLQVGKRIITLEKMLNLREGLTIKDDDLPEFFKEKHILSGPSAGCTVDIEKMRDEYYSIMGWEENGVPSQKCLEELGLEEHAD